MQALAAAPLALFAQAAAPIASGLSAASQSRAMREQNRINAEIGRIRANQTDTVARQGMEDDLSEFRAAFSANDAGMNVANLGLLGEVRQMRERERRINTGAANQQSADYARRARSQNPSLAIARGFAQGAPSLFEFYGSLR